MTNAELNKVLYQKMFAEQETYREWLLSQLSEEILNHTYEYTVREDILLSMADIFAEKPQLGGKTQAKAQKQQENETVKQIKAFADELKHSGTIDFILSDTAGTVVLSAQEQYLSNDNISEIIGGHFKVLGKVIAICKDETENIDLLRKTTLSILPIDLLTEPFSGFQNDDTKQFNLPELKTQISGPAVIVIPVAIYA